MYIKDHIPIKWLLALPHQRMDLLKRKLAVSSLEFFNKIKDVIFMTQRFVSCIRIASPGH